MGLPTMDNIDFVFGYLDREVTEDEHYLLIQKLRTIHRANRATLAAKANRTIDNNPTIRTIE